MLRSGSLCSDEVFVALPRTVPFAIFAMLRSSATPSTRRSGEVGSTGAAPNLELQHQLALQIRLPRFTLVAEWRMPATTSHTSPDTGMLKRNRSGPTPFPARFDKEA